MTFSSHQASDICEIGHPSSRSRRAPATAVGATRLLAGSVVLAPGYGLGPGVVAVAAHRNFHGRPAGADVLNDVAQAQRDLGAARAARRGAG
jgi:hypothetical protein